MSKTLKDILDYTCDLVGIKLTDTKKRNKLIPAVNEAYEKITDIIPIEKTDTVSITDNVGDLPSDLKKAIRVEYNDNEVTGYIARSGKIYINMSDDNVSLVYAKKPIELLDETNEIEIDDRYYRAMSYYAATIYNEMDEEYEAANRYMFLFDKQLNDIKGDAQIQSSYSFRNAW